VKRTHKSSSRARKLRTPNDSGPRKRTQGVVPTGEPPLETLTPTEERGLRVVKVLSTLYLLSRGHLIEQVPLAAVREKAGVEKDAWLDAVRYAESLGLLELRQSSSVAITCEGIVRFEEVLRLMLMDDGRPAVSESEYGRHFELWQSLLWERHLFLTRLHALLEGRLKRWIDHRRLIDPEMGLSTDAVRNAYFFLREEGLLDTSSNLGLVGLSAEGVRQVEEAARALRSRGIANPTREEFLAFLEERWKAEAARPEGERELRAEDYPEEYFKDEDGVWLTVPVLRDRFGIPKSRLKDWREEGCPNLGVDG